MSPPQDSPEPHSPALHLSRRGFLSATTVAATVATFGSSVLTAPNASAAWGGYQNGQIPLSALAPIPWKTSDYLRSDAVTALAALNVAFRAHFGYNLPVSSAYREYATQIYWRNYWCSRGACGNAAVPGTSNHGWAIAIDIGVPIDGWSNPIYLWMKANAATWGWIHPAWAEPGGAQPDEAWHWEYNGAYSGTPTTPQPEPTIGIADMTFLCMTPINGVNADAGIYRWIIDPAAGTKRNIDGSEYDYLKAVGYREVSGLQPPTAASRYQQIHPVPSTP